MAINRLVIGEKSSRKKTVSPRRRLIQELTGPKRVTLVITNLKGMVSGSYESIMAQATECTTR